MTGGTFGSAVVYDATELTSKSGHKDDAPKIIPSNPEVDIVPGLRPHEEQSASRSFRNLLSKSSKNLSSPTSLKANPNSLKAKLKKAKSQSNVFVVPPPPPQSPNSDIMFTPASSDNVKRKSSTKKKKKKKSTKKTKPSSSRQLEKPSSSRRQLKPSSLRQLDKPSSRRDMLQYSSSRRVLISDRVEICGEEEKDERDIDRGSNSSSKSSGSTHKKKKKKRTTKKKKDKVPTVKEDGDIVFEVDGIEGADEAQFRFKDMRSCMLMTDPIQSPKSPHTWQKDDRHFQECLARVGFEEVF